MWLDMTALAEKHRTPSRWPRRTTAAAPRARRRQAGADDRALAREVRQGAPEPGRSYGKGGENHMRMNIATSRKTLEKALSNMANAHEAGGAVLGALVDVPRIIKGAASPPEVARLRPVLMARIVLTSFGSFGDLNPYIGLGLALKARGHTPVLAVPPIYREIVSAEGLEFRGMRPDLPIDDHDLTRRIMDPKKGTEVLFRELLLPGLPQSHADLTEACQGADLLVTHPATMAGPIVAAQRGRPVGLERPRADVVLLDHRSGGAAAGAVGARVVSALSLAQPGVCVAHPEDYPAMGRAGAPVPRIAWPSASRQPDPGRTALAASRARPVLARACQAAARLAAERRGHRSRAVQRRGVAGAVRRTRAIPCGRPAAARLHARHVRGGGSRLVLRSERERRPSPWAPRGAS